MATRRPVVRKRKPVVRRRQSTRARKPARDRARAAPQRRPSRRAAPRYLSARARASGRRSSRAGGVTEAQRAAEEWDDASALAKAAKASGANVYFIHDNGGRPFDVVVSKKPNITIDVIARRTGRVALRFVNPGAVWIGQDPQHKVWGVGNSILVHDREDPRAAYSYIGWEVYSFHTAPGDVIRRFASKIGNSDVVYAWAVGDEYTYLLAEKVRVPNAWLQEQRTRQPGRDPYDIYYHNGASTSQKFPVTVIVPRQS